MDAMPDFHYHGPVVCFDLDDTLASERLYCLSSFRAAEEFLRVGLGNVFEGNEVVALMEGGLMEGVPGRHYDRLEERLTALIGRESAKEAMRGVVGHCRAHIPDAGYALRPEVAQTLETLLEAGVRMGLVTDGRSLTQRRKIQALGLDRFLDPALILISGETGKGKESPDNFEAIVRLLPEASRFLYVADNPEKDFLQPNLLGWRTFMVLPPEGDPNLRSMPTPPWPGGAEVVLGRMKEIINYIG